LQVLEKLIRLRGVILCGSRAAEDDICRFRASHPHVTVTM